MANKKVGFKAGKGGLKMTGESSQHKQAQKGAPKSLKTAKPKKASL